MKPSERFLGVARTALPGIHGIEQVVTRRDLVLGEIIDALDERLSKLEAPRRATMECRPNANATVTSGLVDGERVYLIHLRDRLEPKRWQLIQVDQTTLIDLWNAIEAAS